MKRHNEVYNKIVYSNNNVENHQVAIDGLSAFYLILCSGGSGCLPRTCSIGKA